MKTQYIFFSGKGTLIITTNPASNLADVFEQPIGHKITPIQGALNLWALEFGLFNMEDK